MRTTSDYPESFDEWLGKAQFNPAVMNLIYQIYQHDQVGKMNQETLIIGLRVKRKDTDNYIASKIDSLSNFMSVGMLDDLIKLREANTDT